MLPPRRRRPPTPAAPPGAPPGSATALARTTAVGRPASLEGGRRHLLALRAQHLELVDHLAEAVGRGMRVRAAEQRDGNGCSRAGGDDDIYDMESEDPTLGHVKVVGETIFSWRE